MSFSQFNVNRMIYGSSTVEPSGSAYTNSSLSLPLTGSTYCRKFYHETGHLYGGYAVSEVKSFISSSVQGGVFVDTNTAYALSLRAKVRLENQYCVYYNPGPISFNGYEQNNYIGVTAYSPPSATGTPNSGLVYSGGYELVLQKGNANEAVQLAIRAGQGIVNFSTLPLVKNFVSTCSGSYTQGEWYHIRMDVIPASLTQTTINAYTSSNNGATWNLVGTANIDNSSPSYRNTGNCGFISSKIQSSYNIIPSSYSIDQYIDDFEAYVST